MHSNKILPLLGMAAVLGLGSCSTITHTAATADVETRLYNLTVADLEVKEEKASATEEWQWTPFTAFNLTEAKNNAAAKLLEQNGGDVLLEPNFTVTRRGFMRGGSVTVTGFPAKYTNFHAMSREEAEILNPPAVVGGDFGPLAVSNPHNKGKKARRPSIFRKAKPIYPGFLNVFVGPALDLNGEGDAGFGIGLTYGNARPDSWGWYAKGMIYDSKANVYDGHRYEDVSKTGFALMAGVMKTFGSKFAVHLGTGVGNRWNKELNMWYDNDSYWGGFHHEADELKAKFSLPIDLGFMFRASRLNVGLGATYMTQFGSGPDGDQYAAYDVQHGGTLVPYVSVGFSF